MNKAKLCLLLCSVIGLINFTANTHKSIEVDSIDQESIKLNSFFLYFENEATQYPSKSFFSKLRDFQQTNKLNLKEMSELLHMLNIPGNTAKYSFKGNMYVNNQLIVYPNGYDITQEQKKNIMNRLIVLDSKNDDKENMKLLDLSINGSVCKISIIDFHNNTAQYYSTEDSYGLSISNNNNPIFAYGINKPDSDIKTLSNLPSNFSEKQKNMAASLANIINEVKKEQHYTNKEISKILSMSNIQGVKFTYHDFFQDGHLKITPNGYVIDTISQSLPWKNDKSESHYLVVFSTNPSTETRVIATTEVKDLHNLKFLIFKDDASFIYDTEKMKVKTVIQ